MLNLISLQRLAELRFLMVLRVISGLVLLSVNWAHAAELPQTVDIELTTHLGDRQTFSEGDTLSFLLSLNQESFVYVYYQDAKGDVFQIVPNRDNENNFFAKGYFKKIPSDRDNFRFKVAAPFGQEAIYAFASDAENIKLSGVLLSNGLFRSSESIQAIETIIYQRSTSLFGKTELQLKTQALE